ncbi:peptidase M3A and M3B thimet/oligopeptidase F [Candidatus Halobonum tyrrellensis G22]|uniref:Peptidase M3A and M3B thimet/oligopeptidase F n=2 Tax=Candidatus Halobonum TaxID=1431544 RepID=V4GX31_9EURY|nr:peptidase M3A and M3B thimet/oligopeptidase F [Candidatus Halobonum tyrrellensis G22]
MLSDLDEYSYYAQNLRTQASRMREPAVEEAIATHAEARSAPTRIHRATTTEDFDPPTIERPDGDPVDLSVGNKRTELSHSDRDYRQTVYKTYYEEMERFEATLTRTIAEKLSAAATEAEIRDYDSIRDRDLRGTYPESGLEPALPESVHETLVAAVRDNLEPYHRSQRVRRERLGVDTLRPWDRRVPTADTSPPELEYEDATSLILAALEPLGEQYVELARTFLSERRIDVFPTEDKRTDIPAYCPSSATDGAFVLANFHRDVRTMFYIAHELGHALTAMLYQPEPTRYATAPTAICEVPSILHEVLLAEHCLDAGGALAAHARDRLIECLSGNFYRNARTAAFNHRLATTIEAGDELSPRMAREAYANLLAEFDPTVDFPGDSGREWLGHGQRIPYSSYQYVLGATGALGVRERLRDESLRPIEYREFLRTIGRHPPVESFETLGVDVLSDESYERAAATFDDYLDRL